MHIVVSIKQVPDTAEVRIDPRTNTMIRSGVPSIVNPEDVHAIEEAVRLREAYGGRVTALTMGPNQATAALREAVSLGADGGVLCADRGFAGADTLATSYVLWKALLRLDREEPVDLLLCGRQALDGDTGQVPPGIATRMGWPQLTSILDIEDIDLENRWVRVQRMVEGGRELVRARLPAVMTCTRDLNVPRYASLPNMLRAARYEPVIWDKAALGIADDDPNIGLRGSPTIVSKVWAPAPRQRGEAKRIDAADPQQGAAQLLRVLSELGLVRRGSTAGTPTNGQALGGPERVVTLAGE
jgi:electron transfer flavoprotein beta subunit